MKEKVENKDTEKTEEKTVDKGEKAMATQEKKEEKEVEVKKSLPRKRWFFPTENYSSSELIALIKKKFNYVFAYDCFYYYNFQVYL